MVQLVYLCCALYEDILILSTSSTEKIQKIKYFNAFLFSSMVIPFACLTTTLFWSFYITNIYLLAPYSILSKIPLPWQIATHLLIMVPVITETIFANRPISAYKSSFRYFNIAILTYGFA